MIPALRHVSRHLVRWSPWAKLWLTLSIDLVALPLCAFVAVALGPGGITQAVAIPLWMYALAGLFTLALLALADLYRTVVRFIDRGSVAKTCMTLVGAAVLMYLASDAFPETEALSSALVIYWFVALTYVIVSRLLARAVIEATIKRRHGPRRKTLIYGAGEAGVQLARTMSISSDYEPVCFIDDAPALQGRIVAGLRVQPPSKLQHLVDRHRVDQIVVAIPSASGAQRRQLIEPLERLGVPVKALPSLTELVDGEVSLADIREINESDLLGREPVPCDPQLFARNLRGKSVMVTGAGGSIGSELCRQILSQQPAKLVLFDHSEFALYTIEQELRHASDEAGSAVELLAVLGSVLNEALLRSVMQEHGVQTVYHAAAYKHVPIVEANVRQGVMNNVFGTQAVARAARDSRVETCVLISTDKAVRPTNVMGASKRIAELVFQGAAASTGAAGAPSSTVYSMVRFGNVLGSSGSVVPLFKRQIKAGGPITITHPDIIRYFMLIPEAAQLVIQAGAMAQGGEVFVLDMGEPVRIADLARTMLHLMGLTECHEGQPDGDIAIRYVGLRPGEKLFEELLIGDNVQPSDHPRIMRARERHIEPLLLEKMLGSLRAACEKQDHDQGDDAVMRQVRNLVPEYTRPEHAPVVSRPMPLAVLREPSGG
ncbi:MAG TPA: nucleoside-diphosphate sugar epimerase/dehydratase [Methylibium sp.]|uniref:polysaccharide biosynthesis protein n=1 Tax=Methylibium sp. TaxID=2067992 RepID=UPI002DBDBC40|nr:nucleoside-diphosphate sugar epimerase/dehydratase [Methylibium sp.]HEU4460735.1 nucleoside-diphosphate sugar epimerase/dehydratase [Methylibium sp.]